MRIINITKQDPFLSCFYIVWIHTQYIHELFHVLSWSSASLSLGAELHYACTPEEHLLPLTLNLVWAICTKPSTHNLWTFIYNKRESLQLKDWQQHQIKSHCMQYNRTTKNHKFSANNEVERCHSWKCSWIALMQIARKMNAVLPFTGILYIVMTSELDNAQSLDIVKDIWPYNPDNVS